MGEGMENSYTRIRNVMVFLMIFILIFQTVPTFFNLNLTIKADENTPEYKNNGWWNTTEGKDWIINTTGNVWVNKNISVKGSIILDNGGNLSLQNCTIIVNTNCIINYNSSLTLINTTLKFNATENGSAELLVKSGGSILIRDYDNDPGTKEDGSNITSNNTDNKHRFLFFVYNGANFTMVNSELHHCGYWIFSPDEYGLYIRAGNSIIENNTFSNNYAGLVIESSNNIIRNNTFVNNDRYGFLIFIGRNNTLDNNTIENNSFNFGLFLKNANQSNNFTNKNMVGGRPIYYFERTNNVNFSIESEAGFIGLVNSSNITISGQKLKKNFEGLFVLGVNESLIKNTNLTNNIFGAIMDISTNITLSNCNISDNSDIGINLIDSCCGFKIYNSTFNNNSMAIVASNSEIMIYNSTFSNSKISDFQLEKGSRVRAINCTLDPNKVQISGGSKFEGQQYLHMRTLNHNNISFGNITVDIYDGNNNHVNTIITNASGYANWIPCTSYMIITSGNKNSSMTNHRLHVRFSGMDFNQYVDMNSSQNVIIYLNYQPQITNPPNSSIFLEEETNFYWDFNYTDGDGDSVTWHYKSNGNWFDPIGLYTGIFNGTPGNLDIGIFYINVSCNDSYNGFDFFNFTIIVNNTNDPPMITSKQNAGNAFEDKFFLHDFDVYDPDPGDSHTWTMNTNAKWLYPINKLFGTIYGTPVQNHVGDYFVNISVEDKELEVESYNFTLTVHPTNDKPIITNRENRTVIVLEDSTYYYNFNYYDEDQDEVTWFLTTNASWLWEIDNASGEVSGIPHNIDVGIFFVNVSCMDANNSIAYQNYSIEVRNTNDPPEFLPISVNKLYALEDEYFEHSFEASDPDLVDDLEFSMYTQAIKSRDSNNSAQIPGKWLQLTMEPNSRHCMIFGIPTNDDVGELYVELTCSDIKGTDANINFSIIINNSNDAPWVTNREDNFTYALEDFEYYHDFDFQDIDGDLVTWSLNTNAKWLNDIGVDTGELSGLPTQKNLGVYFVEVFCHDPFGGLDSQNFTIQVNNTNDPPIISNYGLDTVYIFEHEFYYHDFNSTDYDSSKVFWSSHSDAPWLVTIDRFTGIINGTPGDRDIGEFQVNITCMDSQFAVSYWNYTIIVLNVNDPPMVSNGYLAPRIIDLDKQYHFKFEHTDLDGDSVNWSIKTNAGLWLDFDSENALLSGTPNRLNIGSYYINISCQDPHDGLGFYQYDLRVRGTENRPPELSKGYISPSTGDEDTTFTFYVTYRDFDYHIPTVVGVMIGDTPLFLEPYDGDDIFVGIVYSNSTKLLDGSYSFYFYAKDELNAMAYIVDNTTATIDNPSIIEVDKKSDDGDRKFFNLEQLEDPICFSIFILFIIVILILIGAGVIQRRRKKVKQVPEEVEPQVPVPKKKKEVAIPDADVPEPEPEEVPKDYEDEEPIFDEIPEIEEILEPKEEVEEEVAEPTEQPKDIMICPECGEFVNETYDSCPGCGVRFSFEGPKEAASAPESVETEETDDEPDITDSESNLDEDDAGEVDAEELEFEEDSDSEITDEEDIEE